MKARILIAGFFTSSLFGLEDTKLAFTCKQDDIQWAGMTCPEKEPCAVYLELSGVGSAGNKVFLSGNLHTSQTTLYSLLLRSDDGGTTWQEPLGRVRGELLDHIQFENLEAGWVSGQRAMPLASDAFLLATSDGGRSWRKVAVAPEGSPGFIQKFRFDSATTGRMLMDRGAGDADEPRFRIYETQDGGGTWRLVESSATAMKNAPVPEVDAVWRLRADKGGKAFLAEKRSGAGWVVAARFVIQVGECREE